MPIVLRTGTAEDADACAQVWERSVAARDGRPPVDLLQVQRRLRSGAGRLRIVDESPASHPLGFALSLRAGGDVLVSHLAVLPDSQRRGIAVLLMDDAAEHARRRDAARLLLEVRVGNAAAIALYAGLGFLALRAPVPHPLGGQPMQLLGLGLR